MKRYMVFVGDIYYPSCGMNDFINSFEDKVSAIEFAKRKEGEDPWGKWSQVYDLEEQTVIYGVKDRHRDIN